ncbi:MAG: lipopolysaccharide biosynthesis protein RfbH [Akkermansia sp.]
MTSQELQDWKERILKEVRAYSSVAHANCRPGNDPQKTPFHPGIDTVPYAGRVFTEDEVSALVSSSLDFWLTLGKEGKKLEEALEAFLGVKKTILVNSGSSANLIAFATLTSHKLPAEKRILPGDEIITVAAGFPTTVSPIIQHGGIPVFIDANTITGNACTEQLEAAYNPLRTKAVMMAHALGNPFNLSDVLAFCRKYDLWLIEDNCDALGCSYSMPLGQAQKLGLTRLIKLAEKNAKNRHTEAFPRIVNGNLEAYTGSFGDISTQSFYPPHHLTMGEGGAVNIVADMKLKLIAESIRDWGRDCWCGSGLDDTCHKRFSWQLGELPFGYDHKYTYSHLGYNLKPLDLQAAIGYCQMEKLPSFIQARKNNWLYLRQGLVGLEDVIEFSLPTHATGWTQKSGFSWDDTGCRTECSWFGFKMSVKPNAPFSRTDFAKCLDEKKIGNRMLFGGNLVRQPAFVQLKKDAPEGKEPFKIATSLNGADSIMNNTIFIGTYPGLSKEMMNYVIQKIREFAGR